MLSRVFTAAGMFLVAMGTLFALQGAGLLMWPADSVMLARAQWVPRGLAMSALGMAVLAFARTRGRR
jgi:hypothetical protein